MTVAAGTPWKVQSSTVNFSRLGQERGGGETATERCHGVHPVTVGTWTEELERCHGAHPVTAGTWTEELERCHGAHPVTKEPERPKFVPLLRCSLALWPAGTDRALSEPLFSHPS